MERRIRGTWLSDHVPRTRSPTAKRSVSLGYRSRGSHTLREPCDDSVPGLPHRPLTRGESAKVEHRCDLTQADAVLPTMPQRRALPSSEHPARGIVTPASSHERIEHLHHRQRAPSAPVSCDAPCADEPCANEQCPDEHCPVTSASNEYRSLGPAQTVADASVARAGPAVARVRIDTAIGLGCATRLATVTSRATCATHRLGSTSATAA